MILFRDLATAYEMRLLHARVVDVLRWIDESGAWTRCTGQTDYVVTDIWRSRQETESIYAAAGKPPPALSVHELTKVNGQALTGVRGIDFSIRRVSWGLPYASWPRLPVSGIVAFVDAVNAAWRYHAEERYQVALYHSVSGPHIHLQVARDDLTTRR